VPQLPDLDDFPYVAQEEDCPDCVVACVRMVLLRLGLDRDQREIELELGYLPDLGTVFEHIAGISGVRAIRVGSVQDAEQHLEMADPVIGRLWIDDHSVLGYAAEQAFLHAVVVVGVEEQDVTFFDPHSTWQLNTVTERACDRRLFEDAWLGGFVLLPLR